MPSHKLRCWQKKVSGIWSASARERRSFFSNRNSALHSIGSMVSRSNSSYSLYGNQGFLETFCSHKRANYSSSIVPSPWATSSSSLPFANDAMFLLYLRSVVLFENWGEVAVAVLLNIPRRLQHYVVLAPAFTQMCRRRHRHLPSWCLRSLIGGNYGYQFCLWSKVNSVTWTRATISSKSLLTSTVMSTNRIGAVCIHVTIMVAGGTFINV